MKRKATYRRPTMMHNGKQVLVSRNVMARAIGRPLRTDELVHHINGDPFDNRIENLQIVSRAEHKHIHSDIGVSTRLKKKWILDEEQIIRRFRTESASDIAESVGCHYKTITRILKRRYPSIDFRSLRRRATVPYSSLEKRQYERTKL